MTQTKLFEDGHTIGNMSLMSNLETVQLNPSEKEQAIKEELSDENIKDKNALSNKKTGTWTCNMYNICVVMAYICGNFFAGAYLSILAPFFPQQAVAKGVSETIIGLIFSSFEIAIVIFSPLFGNYLSVIGAKFANVAGLFVTGISCILFGLLGYSPGGPAYITACLLTRLVEGIGLAAFLVSSLTIMAQYFPEKATILASVSATCIAIGIMVGPAVGGVLYEFGGYVLPFVVFGLLTLVTAFVSMCLLTPQTIDQKQKQSILSLLKIPLVMITCVLTFINNMVAGLRNVGVALWLERKFGLTPSVIGLVFFAHALAFVATVLVVGFLCDRFPKKSLLVMLVGFFLLATSFIFLGPVPFIPISDNILWLFILSMMLFAVGSATKIAFFQTVTVATIGSVMEKDSNLMTKITGLYHLSSASGNTVGPFLAGYMMEMTGFRYTTAIFAFISIFCAIFTLGYIIVDCFSLSRNKQTTDDDTTHLIMIERQGDNNKSYQTLHDNQN